MRSLRLFLLSMESSETRRLPAFEIQDRLGRNISLFPDLPIQLSLDDAWEKMTTNFIIYHDTLIDKNAKVKYSFRLVGVNENYETLLDKGKASEIKWDTSRRENCHGKFTGIGKKLGRVKFTIPPFNLNMAKATISLTKK